jgi:hypothetical protein
MRLRALVIGLLAMASLPSAPAADPAHAASRPPVMPSISVSTRTASVKQDGKRRIVVRSVTVSNIRPAVKLAIRCRGCHRMRRTKIYRTTRATSRTYSRIYWVLPPGRGISIDALEAGMLGRWTILGPGRRHPNRLVFKASGCLNAKRKRVRCPAGTTLAPPDSPVPTTPAPPPAPAPVPPPPPPPAPPAPAPPPAEICCGAVLHAQSADRLRSADGRYELVMQPDANLVLYYVPANHALWSSGTFGTGADRAVMQNDGNFVIYRAATSLWQSSTLGYTNAKLVVQSDGNVVIYGAGAARWSTGTAGKT